MKKITNAILILGGFQPKGFSGGTSQNHQERKGAIVIAAAIILSAVISGSLMGLTISSFGYHWLAVVIGGMGYSCAVFIIMLGLVQSQLLIKKWGGLVLLFAVPLALSEAFINSSSLDALVFRGTIESHIAEQKEVAMNALNQRELTALDSLEQRELGGLKDTIVSIEMKVTNEKLQRAERISQAEIAAGNAQAKLGTAPADSATFYQRKLNGALASLRLISLQDTTITGTERALIAMKERLRVAQQDMTLQRERIEKMYETERRLLENKLDGIDDNFDIARYHWKSILTSPWEDPLSTFLTFALWLLASFITVSGPFLKLAIPLKRYKEAIHTSAPAGP